VAFGYESGWTGNGKTAGRDVPGVKRKLAAASAAVTACAVAAVLVLTSGQPAQADPPIGVGLLDPNCLVSVVLNGQTVCLVYVSPTATPPPTHATATQTVTGTP
jgi:hypothetical protein